MQHAAVGDRPDAEKSSLVDRQAIKCIPRASVTAPHCGPCIIILSAVLQHILCLNTTARQVQLLPVPLLPLRAVCFVSQQNSKSVNIICIILSPEDGSSMYLRNVYIYLQIHRVTSRKNNVHDFNTRFLEFSVTRSSACCKFFNDFLIYFYLGLLAHFIRSDTQNIFNAQVCV